MLLSESNIGDSFLEFNSNSNFIRNFIFLFLKKELASLLIKFSDVEVSELDIKTIKSFISYTEDYIEVLMDSSLDSSSKLIKINSLRKRITEHYVCLEINELFNFISNILNVLNTCVSKYTDLLDKKDGFSKTLEVQYKKDLLFIQEYYEFTDKERFKSINYMIETDTFYSIVSNENLSMINLLIAYLNVLLSISDNTEVIRDKLDFLLCRKQDLEDMDYAM